MASTVPAKSQPLHNFNLPHLKWNKDGSSSGQHQRRRSVKSPSRRLNSSGASPVSQSPLRDPVPAGSSRRESPLRDSPRPQSSRESPVGGDSSAKPYPISGESSKPYLVREQVKQSPIGGDSLKNSTARGDSAKHLPRHDSTSESEASGKREGSLIEYRRNHSKNFAANISNTWGDSKNSEHKSGEKIDKRRKAAEANASNSKRSKILIKIPCKNNKPEEENPAEEPPNNENNDEGDETDDAKILSILEEEAKTWNLRPRKPIRQSLNINGGAMRLNGSGTVKANGGALKTSGGGSTRNSGPDVPEKNKAPSPSKNVNYKAGENEANGSGGCEKKEKKRLNIFISLMKEEIEEDIYSLTGSKPSRRPKKRAKNVQKQLDFVFPGLWLQGITSEAYKVSENSLKV